MKITRSFVKNVFATFAIKKRLTVLVGTLLGNLTVMQTLKQPVGRLVVWSKFKWNFHFLIGAWTNTWPQPDIKRSGPKQKLFVLRCARYIKPIAWAQNVTLSLFPVTVHVTGSGKFLPKYENSPENSSRQLFYNTILRKAIYRKPNCCSYMITIDIFWSFRYTHIRLIFSEWVINPLA